MEYIVQAATTKGLRKETNQDSLMIRVCETSRGKAVLAVMCDGMGGLARGELASASVVRAFDRWLNDSFPMLCAKPMSDAVIRAEWTQLVLSMNHKIYQYGKQNHIQLGTTVTALLLTEGRYCVLQVGDSRCYEISSTVRQLTEDQSLVWKEYKQGLLTEEQMKTDPRRNILLECVGADERVEPQFVFGVPKKDAVYVLCSDGFYHEPREAELCAELDPSANSNDETLRMSLERLINLCMEREEQDNITTLAIRTFGQRS